MTNLTLHPDHLAWQQRIQCETVTKNRQFDFLAQDPRARNAAGMERMMGSTKYATVGRNGYGIVNASDPNQMRDSGFAMYSDYTVFSQASPGRHYANMNRPVTSSSLASYTSKRSGKSVDCLHRKTIYDSPLKEANKKGKNTRRKNKDNYRFGGKTNIKEAQGRILDEIMSQSNAADPNKARENYAKNMQMLQNDAQQRLKTSSSVRSLNRANRAGLEIIRGSGGQDSSAAPLATAGIEKGSPSGPKFIDEDATKEKKTRTAIEEAPEGENDEEVKERGEEEEEDDDAESGDSVGDLDQMSEFGSRLRPSTGYSQASSRSSRSSRYSSMTKSTYVEELERKLDEEIAARKRMEEKIDLLLQSPHFSVKGADTSKGKK